MKELTSILSEKQVLKLYDIQLLRYEIWYKLTEAFHKNLNPDPSKLAIGTAMEVTSTRGISKRQWVSSKKPT